MSRQQREPVRETSLPSVCLVCGGGARAFSGSEVPTLLDFLRGAVGREAFAEQVRAAFKAPKSEGCFVSPRTGVSVCGRKGIAR